jgi:uncharacterized membrane protein YfcA
MGAGGGVRAVAHNRLMPDFLVLTDIALYLALGLAAGTLAGLLGIGGGLVLVAALAWILPLRGFPADATMQVALATSLATIVFTSLSSTRAHWRRGAVRWPLVAWLTPGLLAGGVAGAVLATWLPSRLLAVFVAVYCLLSAWQLALGRTRAAAQAAAQVGRGLLAIAGVVIGAVSAVVGIGGGSMTVPLLVWRGVVPVQAVATSAACGFAIAVASVAGYVFAPRAAAFALPAGTVGYVYWPAALAMAVTSVLSAPLGASWAHRLPPTRLRQVFAAFLVLIAAMMGWAALRH